MTLTAPGLIAAVLNIEPPYWAAPLVFAVYAVLATVAVYAGLRFFRIRERRRKEARMAEEEMRRREAMDRMKLRFFTSVSDDLRTPLTLIITPLEKMLRSATDHRQAHTLSLMHRNAEKLMSLVDQLLDFRDTLTDGMRLNASEGDFVSFTRSVCATVYNKLWNVEGVEFRFSSDPESIICSFDGDKMMKALRNLLLNAFRVTPEGGVVGVCVTRQDDSVVLSVSDQGPEIPDETRSRMFDCLGEPMDTDERQATILGMVGMPMVREYVGLHDGTVEIVRDEKGRVFRVTMPIRHSDSADADGRNEVLSEEVEEASGCETSEKPVALIVDDSHDMLELVKDGLEDDFVVQTAVDGEDAMRRIARRMPDIVVTDLTMPRMDGMELCRQLKGNALYSSIPVIMLTASHDPMAKLEVFTLGADDYMTKPFNIDVLRLRMKRIMQLSSREKGRQRIEPSPDQIKITPLDEKFIDKAVKYVSENIDSSTLSVEELSEYMGMSRVRLYKKIKTITGKTPIEFIRVIRLKRAAQMLRESQLNVSEIAYQTGFNSPRIFSKYFKEEFGLLPSAYQEKEETPFEINDEL